MALTDKLSAIGEAIRAKTGKSDKLTLDQMPSEIAGITGGGGGANPDANDPVYYVTFMNGDQVLYVRPVVSGDTCPDVLSKGWISEPKKESTAQYSYSCNGWSATDGGSASTTVLQNITEDKTVYAAFKATVRSYTITYYDIDGITVLNTEVLSYGVTPSYSYTKEGYKTIGWIPQLTSVTGDASYILHAEELSGEPWGTNCSWSLKDGLLTINGEGKMPTISTYTEQPWYAQAANITSVVISNGVTNIGSHVFYGLTNLSSITIPDGVESTGKTSFYGCHSLTSVTLPNGLVSIGYQSFLGCKNLTDVNIPSTVTDIYVQAFASCNLASVTIPSRVKYIASSVFSGNNNLASVTFEDTSGWYIATYQGATSGTNIDVTNPTTNATNLTNTHVSKYWYNPTAT